MLEDEGYKNYKASGNKFTKWLQIQRYQVLIFMLGVDDSSLVVDIGRVKESLVSTLDLQFKKK